MQGLGDLLSAVSILGRHRVLHHHQVAVGKINRSAYPAVTLEWVDDFTRVSQHLISDINGWTAGDKYTRRIFAHAHNPLG